MKPQPNAIQVPEELLKSLVRAAAPKAAWPPEEIRHHHQFSNDFAEVRLPAGRSLVVKRGRYPWSRSRFHSSRLAAGLLGRVAEITAPSPLPLPPELEPEPLEFYWRIDLPVLREVWPRLTARGKATALHSLGQLLARLHSIELQGAGPLSDPATPHRSISDYLRGELEERLGPSIDDVWPAARASCTRLLDALRDLEGTRAEDGRLLHNDFHTGNVLCEVEGETVSCVGVVDLETAMVGPPEADVASLEVHHGPLFNHPLEEGWVARVEEGYGNGLDPWLIRFFRLYHLINMGFFSALIGHDVHAAEVAAAATAEAVRL